MLIIKANWYFDFLHWVSGEWYSAQAFLGLPIMLYKDMYTSVTLVQEKIHVRQALELLYVGFWLLYLGHWGWNRWVLKLKDGKAYENIVFEKEAHANNYELNYLRLRKWYAWWAYW
jgi:hypothetical protein